MREKEEREVFLPFKDPGDGLGSANHGPKKSILIQEFLFSQPKIVRIPKFRVRAG